MTSINFKSLGWLDQGSNPRGLDSSPRGSDSPIFQNGRRTHYSFIHFEGARKRLSAIVVFRICSRIVWTTSRRGRCGTTWKVMCPPRHILRRDCVHAYMGSQACQYCELILALRTAMWGTASLVTELTSRGPWRPFFHSHLHFRSRPCCFCATCPQSEALRPVYSGALFMLWISSFKDRQPIHRPPHCVN